MPVWMQPVANSRPGRFISHMVRRYFAHDVGRQGAALAYYLLFTIFPFLIFLSSLLGLLDLDISGITRSLEALLPETFFRCHKSFLVNLEQVTAQAPGCVTVLGDSSVPVSRRRQRALAQRLLQTFPEGGPS